jgi:hypothetical protein
VTIRRIFMTMVLALSMPTAASAISFSADLDTDDCFSADLDDCVGGLYRLEVAQESGNDRYQATITADYRGDYDLDLTLGDAYVTHIEIKVANSYLDPLTSLFGTVEDGPLSGSGCNGNNDGFLCIQLNSPELAEDLMTWTIDFGTGALLGDEDWHLGMRFEWENPGNGKTNSALLSGHAQAVPEPSAALLFVIGIGVVHQGVRRRR